MTVRLEQGAIVAERYQLDHLLGEGGMGSVWAATHTITLKPVALKFLKATTETAPKMRKRFLREARAASAVRHPNVVQVHDILELDDGFPVMVMDLLHGESLGALRSRLGRIPLRNLANIMVPVLSAIGTAHAAGIIHRDLKPDNIFLENTPSGVVAKVLDFGIAKVQSNTEEITEGSKLTQTGALLGTPYYMAPEQAFGEPGIDHGVDVWAVGVILYECLSARRPVDGDNLGQLFKVLTTGEIVPLDEIAPEVPPEISSLVMRMLSVQRANRPRDLREVFEALRAYTSVRADTFPDAGPLLTVSWPTDTNRSRESLAMATTEAAVSARTVPSTGKSRRAGLVAGLVIGTCGLGVGAYAVSFSGSGSSVGTPAPSASELFESNGPASNATADASADVRVMSVDASPVADVSAAPPGPKTPTPRPPGTWTGTRVPPASAKTAAPAPPTAPPTTTQPSQLPGGVVSAPPF